MTENRMVRKTEMREVSTAVLGCFPLSSLPFVLFYFLSCTNSDDVFVIAGWCLQTPKSYLWAGWTCQNTLSCQNTSWIFLESFSVVALICFLIHHVDSHHQCCGLYIPKTLYCRMGSCIVQEAVRFTSTVWMLSLQVAVLWVSQINKISFVHCNSCGLWCVVHEWKPFHAYKRNCPLNIILIAR